MNFAKNWHRCLGLYEEYFQQFLWKFIEKFYFYLILNSFFLEFKVFYYHKIIFKTKMDKNIQMSS